MSLKILGGFARGLSLKLPDPHVTRPTGALLKRKLFDWRQSWEKRCFVDLCAGTGSMGLEASSRGAQKIWLNERNKNAFKILQQNSENVLKSVAAFDFYPQMELTQKDFRLIAEEDIFRFAGTMELTLFFDPPYEDKLSYAEFLKMFSLKNIEIIMEYSKLQTGTELQERLMQCFDSSRYQYKEFYHSDRGILIFTPFHSFYT
jgi:16S rRNA (guanine966-N2)-methyltransferase